MEKILLLLLILLPILASVWVFPLRRRDRRYRNLFIRIVPAAELLLTLLLVLVWPDASLELPGVPVGSSTSTWYSTPS